jgi:glycosyltransferase involved in cell wall biosynthesis
MEARSMKLDIIANDGSPLGVSLDSVYGRDGRMGVGGAELALLTLCEGWHTAGHQVRLYNNPTYPNGSPFPQYPIDTFVPQEDRDVVIVFRSPNVRLEGAKGLKVWFSTDQTTVGNFKEFSTKVDKVVTISPFHAEYFRTAYGIENTITIDLPVRLQDYKEQVDKIPNRMIFCSVPDRGLMTMAQAFPIIKQAIPDASLVITSDYRLWGVDEPRNDLFVRKFLGMDGVKFLGAIPRLDMVREQMLAVVQPYSCNYAELFCYATAECQAAGAYPVTTSIGALATTNMGTQVAGDANDPHWVGLFANEVIRTLQSNDLREQQLRVQADAWIRFSLDSILKQWDEKVFQ